MEYEDTSSQEHEQKKLVIRRDKVVVTKVTEQELSQIKETASRCGMTRSDFIRARVLGYKPLQRLSDRELDGLRQLATCRTDMVNFANALHGLTDNEKLRLFRHEETMLEWYEKVAHVTNHVADFLQSTQTANSYPAGEQTKKLRRTAHDSQRKGGSPRHKGDALCVGGIEEQEASRKDNAHLRQLHAAGYGRYGYLDGNEVRYHEPPQHQEQCHPHGD